MSDGPRGTPFLDQGSMVKRADLFGDTDWFEDGGLDVKLSLSSHDPVSRNHLTVPIAWVAGYWLTNLVDVS